VQQSFVCLSYNSRMGKRRGGGGGNHLAGEAFQHLKSRSGRAERCVYVTLNQSVEWVEREKLRGFQEG
jgi:hypothetical protein